jgi:ribosomal protein S18 acetylase RimI-like enzyme
MTPLDTAPSPAAAREVRPADRYDREQVSSLIFLESHVHKHLDWKTPLDWLGRTPFMVLQEGGQLSAALACPPDPPSIAWLRLFVFASHLNGRETWRLLWPAAMQRLEAQGGGTAAAIVTHPWLEPILLEDGFEPVNHIVLLEMNSQSDSQPQTTADWIIRPMVPGDLPRVVDLDAAAFAPLWRNSLEGLASAFNQACYASVAEDDSGLIGYQLATGGAFGTHLARLAVQPAAQGRGLGASLVHDLIAHIPRDREPRLTVNTQADNKASHALYERLGFRRTGERFPVLAVDVGAAQPTQ